MAITYYRGQWYSKVGDTIWMQAISSFSDTIFSSSFTPLFPPLRKRHSEYSILSLLLSHFPLLAPAAFSTWSSSPLSMLWSKLLHSTFPGFLAATLPTYLHAGCGNQSTTTLFASFRIFPASLLSSQLNTPSSHGPWFQEAFLFCFFHLVSFFSKQLSSITRAQMMENKHSRRTFSLCQKNHLFIHTRYARSFLLLKFTFMPAAAAGPPGSTAWMWQGLLPRTTKPQPTASPTIWEQNANRK